MRFAKAKRVPGTRAYHCYIPTEDGRLQVSRVSGEDSQLTVHIFSEGAEMPMSPEHTNTASAVSLTLEQCHIGSYFGRMYDDKCWIGMIRDKSEAESDIQVCFMHPPYPAPSFHWPSREDICWMPLQCIVAFLSAPTTVSGRQYHLDLKDRDALHSALQMKQQ